MFWRPCWGKKQNDLNFLDMLKLERNQILVNKNGNQSIFLFVRHSIYFSIYMETQPFADALHNKCLPKTNLPKLIGKHLYWSLFLIEL